MDILFTSYFYGYTGYAIVSRSIIKYLSRYSDLRIKINAKDSPDNTNLLDKDKSLIETHKAVEISPNNFIAINHVIPFLYQPIEKARYNICLTTWETDVLPESFRKPLSYANEVWTPSPFVPFEKMHNNVKYIPWGVDNDYYKRFYKYYKHRIDTFITVGRWSWRKGWKEIAWYFKNIVPHKKLIAVIYQPDEKTFEMLKSDNIEIIPSDIPQKDMQSLYTRADAYISFSYGEGVGLPALEAAQSGLHMYLSDIPAYRHYIEADDYFTTKKVMYKDIEKYGSSCSKYFDMPFYAVDTNAPENMYDKTNKKRLSQTNVLTWEEVGAIIYQRLKELEHELKCTNGDSYQKTQNVHFKGGLR